MPPREKTDQPDQAPVEEQTVRLAVGHPYNELVLHDREVDGKPLAITSDGTDVAAADEEIVRNAARDAGVPIRKVR